MIDWLDVLICGSRYKTKEAVSNIDTAP